MENFEKFIPLLTEKIKEYVLINKPVNKTILKQFLKIFWK